MFPLSIQIRLVTFVPLANIQRDKHSRRKVCGRHIKHFLLLAH